MKRIVLFIIGMGITGRSLLLAGGNLHIGTLEIHPVELIEQIYNTNIYSEPKGEENSDQITHSILGLALKKPFIPGREHYFSASYNADIFRYNHFDKEDRTDHTIDALAYILLFEQLFVQAREKYKKTADPPNSELTNFEKRVRNINEGIVGFNGERWNIKVGSQYIRDNYKNLDTLDKKEYITTPQIALNVTPKISLFVECNMGSVTYDVNSTNNDSTFNEWQGGVKGKLTPKITGIIRGGYKKTDYEDERSLKEKNFKGGTGYLSFLYKFFKDNEISIFGSRNTIESTYVTNNYYVANAGGASCKIQLMQRLFLIGSGSYEKNQYPEKINDGVELKKRNDIVRDTSGGLIIELSDWLCIKGEYISKDKDSNSNAYDYTARLYSAGVSLLF